MSTLSRPDQDEQLHRCPSCGAEVPLTESCPSCEMDLHPDGPAAQLARVQAIAEARRVALAAEILAHQSTVKAALSDHAAAYVQLRGLPALCEQKTQQLHAVREALRIRPCEKLWTALECAQQRMIEHGDMAKRLGQLETPVDWTKGGAGPVP